MSEEYAFPRYANCQCHDESGMTLRDYFAAKCDVSVYDPVQTFIGAHGRTPTVKELASYIAEIRIVEADAMLEARK